MTVYANAQGTATGKFTIPAKIKAGTKQVMFKGISGSKSYAETTFTGQGTVVTNTMRQVKNVMQAYYDPLAQTFMLTAARQLHAVDIWVTATGTTPLIVQLRETQTGFPTRVVLAEGRVSQPLSQVGQWVKILFDVPFYASANVEYAVVVLANDDQTKVGISELGKPDLGGSGGYVTTQPYQVGVLLSSANASTWTAHQDKDLTFRLYARKYDQSKTKTVPLGKITLPAGTTDLLISAMTNTPATGADAEIQLIQTANNSTTTLKVSDGQVVKFDAIRSGDMDVVAVLRCTDTASATIAPGTQIIAGALTNTGTYITQALDGKTTKKLGISVTIESLNVNSIKAEYAEYKQGTPITTWTAIPETAESQNNTALLANGRREMVFKVDQVASMALFKIRLTLNGSPAIRPEVFNLRVSVVEV
ncbi:hypothetical protein H8U31_001312 [Salmonella enterica]|nr:hypothetical protein [Salmonella enterica]